MQPAINLMDWLTQIASCQNDPDAINFDGAEDALLELRERATECFAHCEDEPEDTPENSMLYDMAVSMETIADHLDEFLETELFYHLQEAIAECQVLMNLKDQIVATDSSSVL